MTDPRAGPEKGPYHPFGRAIGLPGYNSTDVRMEGCGRLSGYVSVSEVLKLLAKPGLVGWAAEVTARAALGRPEEFWLSAQQDPEAAMKALTGAVLEARKQALRRGIELHRLVFELARKRPFKGPPELEALAWSAEAFFREVNPEPLFIGPRVYSRTHLYFGFADLIARVEARPVLLEFKGGRARFYPEDRLQAAAYAFAEFIGLADGGRIAMPRIEQAFIVAVHGLGYELLPLKPEPKDFKAFLSLRYLFEWLSSLGFKRP